MFRYNPSYRFNPFDPSKELSKAEIEARAASILEGEAEPVAAKKKPKKTKAAKKPKVKKMKKGKKSSLEQKLAAKLSGPTLAMALAAVRRAPKKTKGSKKSKKPAKTVEQRLAAKLNGPQLGMALAALGRSRAAIKKAVAKKTGAKAKVGGAKGGKYRCAQCGKLGHNARSHGKKAIARKGKVGRPAKRGKVNIHSRAEAIKLLAAHKRGRYGPLLKQAKKLICG